MALLPQQLAYYSLSAFWAITEVSKVKSEQESELLWTVFLPKGYTTVARSRVHVPNAHYFN